MLASIGYRCLPMPGAPFDEATGTIANRCFTSYAARNHWDLWTQHRMLFCDQLQCLIDQGWSLAAGSAHRPTRALHWRTARLTPGACLHVGPFSEGASTCFIPSAITHLSSRAGCRGGRVVDQKTGEPEPGLYVTGWAKRGPTGIIGEPSAQVCECHARIPGPCTLRPVFSWPCGVTHLVRQGLRF